MLLFQLARQTPAGVVFRNPGDQGCLAPYLVIMAVLVVGAGVLLYLGDAVAQWPAAALVVTFLGLLGLMAVLAQAHKRPAHTLHFDGEAGVVTLSADDGSDALQWPMRAFHDVELATRLRSSGIDNDDRSVPVYLLWARQRDGTRVYLMETDDWQQREDVANQLQALFGAATDATAVTAALPAAPLPLPAGIVVARDGDDVTARWTTHKAAQSRIGSVALTAMVCLFFALFARAIGETAVMAVIALFPVLGACWWMARVFSVHGRRHRIRLAANAVEYESGRRDPLPRQWSVAPARITALQTHWGSESIDVSISTARDGLPTNQASFGSPLYRLTLGHRPLSHYVLLEQTLQREMLARYGRVVE